MTATVDAARLGALADRWALASDELADDLLEPEAAWAVMTCANELRALVEEHATDGGGPDYMGLK